MAKQWILYLQNWLEAIEDHSAYSTHYCMQEQLSSDEEEDDTVSVAELEETLKVCIKLWSVFLQGEKLQYLS